MSAFHLNCHPCHYNQTQAGSSSPAFDPSAPLDNAFEFSPIHQLDGGLSPPPDQRLVHTPPNHPYHVNLRQAKYTLDRNKQLSRLCKDTKIEDYDITVSPIAHNVTIKCSAGFYTQVVLPSFSNMSLQYHNTTDGVLLHVVKIEGQVDATGASVTAMIVFELKYEQSREKSSIGTVTIHLHHSARKIQLQGSSMVHEQIRAPVWFVDNFLKGIFNHYARSKAVDITNFNNAAHDMLTNHLQKISSQDKCGYCANLFGGRSIPENCSSCKKKFHKSCFQDKSHLCRRSTLPEYNLSNKDPATSSTNLARRQNSTPINVSPVSNSSTAGFSPMTSSTTHLNPSSPSMRYNTDTSMSQSFYPVSTQQATPPSNLLLMSSTPSYTTTATTATTTTTTTTTTTPSPLTQPPNPISSQADLVLSNAVFSSALPDGAAGPGLIPPPTSVHHDPNMRNPSLNPLAVLFVPDLSQPDTPQSSSNTPGPAASRAKKPAKKNSPPQNLDLEYARIELNTAQASIVVLETTINDLRFRNAILEDRIKQIEDKKKTDIYEKYFPPSDQPNVTRQGCACASRAPPQLQCCHQVTTHCCSMNHQPSPSGAENSESILQTIATLKADIEDLKLKLGPTSTPNPTTVPSTVDPPSANAHDKDNGASENDVPSEPSVEANNAADSTPSSTDPVSAPSPLPTIDPLSDSDSVEPETDAPPDDPSGSAPAVETATEQPPNLNSSVTSMEEVMSETELDDDLNCE